MPPPSDIHYRCVADSRRREVLSYLRDREGSAESLDALVDHVVATETRSPAPDGESVAADLYHNHLPLLDDAGAVDFDSRSKTVRYAGNAQVEALLDARVDSDSGDGSDRA